MYLQNKVQTMQYQKQKLERVINTRLVELSDVEKMHQRNFDTLAGSA